MPKGTQLGTKARGLINFQDAEKIADSGKSQDKFGWFLKSLHDNFQYPHDFYADKNWNKNSNQPWRILTTTGNFKALTKGSTKIGKNVPIAKRFKRRGYQAPSRLVDVPFTTANYQLLFVDVGPSTAPNIKQTPQQERGSAWILRRALKDNVTYKDWSDIMSDPMYYQLLDVYPMVDNSWLQSYWRQNARMHAEYSHNRWSEFNRDGGFMKFISDLINEKFGVTIKDQWNPADIWMIRGKSSKIEKRIADQISGAKGTQTIRELNLIMRDLFSSSGSEQVVGVSLKKVPGNRAANWTVFNMRDLTLDERGDYNYNIPEITYKVAVEGEAPHRKFVTQDTKVFLKTPNDRRQASFQIKDNSGSPRGAGNLKFELSIKGEAARGGKAPEPFYHRLMDDVGVKYRNVWQQYPSTLEVFERQEIQWRKAFTLVNSKRYIETELPAGKVGEDQFIINMKEQFGMEDAHGEGPWLARSKLMQLEFLVQMIDALGDNTNDEFREFWTDMAFLGMKKGDTFAPFGKLS